MEHDEEDVVGMALQCLNTTLAEIVPDLDGAIVTRGDKVWLVCAGIEVDVVDALVVRLEGEVRGGRA